VCFAAKAACDAGSWVRAAVLAVGADGALFEAGLSRGVPRFYLGGSGQSDFLSRLRCS